MGVWVDLGGGLVEIIWIEILSQEPSPLCYSGTRVNRVFL